jgi:hypothetical protein
MEDKNVIEQEIISLTTQRDNLRKEIEDYKNDINQSTEGNPSLREQMTSHLSTMESTIKIMAENIDRINAFHSELLHVKEGQTKSQLEIAHEAFLKITADKEKSETELKTIETFKVELLGDNEKNIIGQKQRFDTIESEIKDNKKKWADNAETLFKKIEGLIPGATATGLAKAYQVQRESYNKPYWFWATIFTLTMCGTMWFATENLIDATSVEDAFMKAISRIPFFIPAFWLAIFASKQQSQNKRLQQEYAYKEALTKSYEADKREIEKLPESPERHQLSAKLLETIIDAAKFNPSETLGSKTHNDEPPSVFELFKIQMFKRITGTDQSNP